ncbi:GIY-YIG nuclease family protein [Belliella sp. DSM 107340]|uniref:GIY-YIG nuclease family protein n=1 Tax=Belliella calami TaxID=2923436 RepID=A0ABS9UPQ0_9BACT|nr:GIY-YIG nuclease family protein [Belliella calami]MCH7398606.1 GIY-YIG nuclease family protein [Belliella calami]
MYFVYVLSSTKTDRYYVRSTNDLEKRLRLHNLGLIPSTKGGSPEWKLVFHEVLKTVIYGAIQFMSHSPSDLENSTRRCSCALSCKASM